MQLHKCPKEFYPPLSDYPTFGPKFGDFDLSEGGSLATQSTPLDPPLNRASALYVLRNIIS